MVNVDIIINNCHSKLSNLFLGFELNSKTLQWKLFVWFCEWAVSSDHYDDSLLTHNYLFYIIVRFDNGPTLCFKLTPNYFNFIDFRISLIFVSSHFQISKASGWYEPITNMIVDDFSWLIFQTNLLNKIAHLSIISIQVCSSSWRHIHCILTFFFLIPILKYNYEIFPFF